jgi:hypothetical protein
VGTAEKYILLTIATFTYILSYKVYMIEMWFWFRNLCSVGRDGAQFEDGCLLQIWSDLAKFGMELTDVER